MTWAVSIFGYCTYTAFICFALFLHTRGIDFNNWLILLGFMGFDVITGIAKSYILWDNNPKKKYPDGKVMNDWFQTHKLKIGIISKFLVACLPFAVLFLAEVTWGYSVNFASDILIAVLAAAEFISSIQNIIVVRTGKDIQEFDAITYTLNLILDQVKKMIDGKLGKE